MVYRVSKRFVVLKYLEPIFISTFIPVLLFLVSTFTNIDMDSELIEILIDFMVVSFAILMMYSHYRVQIYRNTVLVVDKNGVVLRDNKRTNVYLWDEIERLEVSLSAHHVVKIRISPQEKEMGVFFMNNIDDLMNDIKSMDLNIQPLIVGKVV
ncbi:MAG: hypothetical protein HWE19_05755 [Vibrionaceae bacterium]|nr:hypothetical protein [Vibrionaceae bacterium]